MARGREWTRAEDLMIADNYANHGPSWPGWAEMMPDRGTVAIRNRAARLGVRSPVAPSAAPLVPDGGGDEAPVASPTHPWEDRQRKALVRLFAVAQDATGHSAAECSVELVRLLEQRGRRGGAGGPRKSANGRGA